MSDTIEKEYAEAAPLQELAAERLAAHRRRRYGFELPTDAVAESRTEEVSQERCGLPTGATRVREAVAERYKHSVSYREFLAVEAERAVEQAKAQVEIATRNVAAVSAAQTKLMEELELWPVAMDAAPVTAEGLGVEIVSPQLPSMTGAVTTVAMPAVRQTTGRAVLHSAASEVAGAVMSAAATPIAPPPGLRVRLHEPMTGTITTLPRPKRAVESEDTTEEQESLDEEIAFRAAPEFDEHLLEPLTIQPNILEFPRQLVAPRRVRPRLAEGPLRDDASQLRIFEVEAATVSVQPVVEAAGAVPEWRSVVLAAPVRETPALPVSDAPTVMPQLKHVAPVMLRGVAMVIDACWVGLGFVGLVCGVVKMMGIPHLLLTPMLGLAGAVLLSLGLVYGLMFLSLAGATPGMMYAEIGLVKYDTTEAKRSTLRLWMLLTLLSALPAGLGLLWAVVDKDGLGWQDRICKVYPRLV